MAEIGRIEQHERLMLVETIGSVLWFIMDGLWMLTLAVPAKGMILPTIAVNFFVFRYTTRSFSHFFVTAAMNAWLLMNVFWMIGDLDKDARALDVARVMFGLGIAFLVLVVLRNGARPQHLTAVLTRFRRLRI